MEVNTVVGEIDKIQADVIIVSYFEGDEKLLGPTALLDKSINNGISQLISSGEIKGQLNEVTLLHTFSRLPATHIAVLGLGKRNELNTDKIRSAAVVVLRLLRQKRLSEIATTNIGPGISGTSATASAQAITEGTLLGLYAFRKHLTIPADYGEINKINIIESDISSLSAIEEACRVGRILADASILTRDMVNEPSNYMTPAIMANIAKELSKAYNFKMNILEREQMQELGMGALLGVSQGSDQPPKFIILRYKGKDDEIIDVALVGKGITFDSGGISLKPSDGMEEMKGDMAGGASVMAAIVAAARLKLDINILAVIPCTENMPGGRSFKPGDILTAMNGKTIEVISTDAEGRLILADALAYTKTFDVRNIIDVATLTGACQIALGNLCTGVFGNNQALIDKVLAAGESTGEKMWQMPMFDEYKELYKSEVADIKNHGGRYGGAIIAAQFLSEFVGDTPWVHLDIAGTSDTAKEKGYVVKGATGIPVRTLVNLLISLANK